LILSTDVQYTDNNALAAGIIFSTWDSEIPTRTVVKKIDKIEPYQPGQFYKRELPCLLALLTEVIEPLEAIIIDGYVTLGQERRPGLGMHLYESIDATIPIVGVAKKAFTETPENYKILRGNSLNPLYVSSIGIPTSEAKALVAKMHGKHRIPTMLKKADQLCRGIAV